MQQERRAGPLLRQTGFKMRKRPTFFFCNNILILFAYNLTFKWEVIVN